jgi:hypothetical protein
MAGPINGGLGRRAPVRKPAPSLKPEAGFEPATSALQERRSGQLSYSGVVRSLRSRGQDLAGLPNGPDLLSSHDTKSASFG